MASDFVEQMFHNGLGHTHSVWTYSFGSSKNWNWENTNWVQWNSVRTHFQLFYRNVYIFNVIKTRSCMILSIFL